MTRRLETQTDFSSGEIAPILHGRVSTERYAGGVETATNATIVPQGPLRRRNGTQYINEVKDSSAETYLVRFQFGKDDAFALEVGNQYMRFYTDKAIVVDSSDFTNGTFDSDISGWTDISAGTGSIAHDAGNSRMDLVGGGAGNEARAEQSGNLGTGSYTITADVVGGDITVKVGTTSGASDIGSGTLATGTGSTYSFSPSAHGTVYFTFENANNDTRDIDNIVLSNTDAYEIDTPWTTAKLANVQYTQFGSQIFFVEPSTEPYVLTRTSTSQWDLSPLDALPEPSVEIGEFPSASLTPGAATGVGVTFTSSAAAFLAKDVGRQIINLSGSGRASITAYTSTTQVTCDIVEDFPSTDAIAADSWKLDLSPLDTLTTASGSGRSGEIVNFTTSGAAFRTTDVGRYIIVQNGVTQIVTVNSSTSVDCEVLKSMTATTATTAWTLEDPAWSATRGYPRAIGFFEQRLILGGTTEQPQTLWMSETGIYDGFGRGANDADSISIDLSSREVNQIQWIAGGRDLIVGTSGAEFSITGSGSALTPSNTLSRPRTYFGSEQQQVATIRNEIIFAQRSGTKLHAFFFNFDIDSYDSQDITFLAEHLPSGGISEISYAQEPDSIIYAVLNTGDMLAGTYIRSERILGWSKLTTNGEFERVITLSEGDTDQVWTIVKRTIDGSTVRYIEVFDSGEGTDELDGFSDCFLKTNNGKTITGITKADPGVVTATAHGFSNGDDVVIKDVSGMTEVNTNEYIVARQATNTFQLASTSRTEAVGTSYSWTASGSGTDEYYLRTDAGADPSVPASVALVYQDDVIMTEGTVGSLATGEWDYGDNDSLGYSTIYVRLTGGQDPDDMGNGWVEYADGIDTSSFTTYTSGGTVYPLGTTVSGLSHLEGETVQVKVDGAAHADKTVSSGAITLDSKGAEVIVGLEYVTTIKTLNKEFDIGMGSMQGQRKRFVRPILRVYQSAKPTLNGEFLPSRFPADLTNTAVPLKTGDLEYGTLTWQTDGELTISISDPFPLTLLGIFGTMSGGVR